MCPNSLPQSTMTRSTPTPSTTTAEPVGMRHTEGAATTVGGMFDTTVAGPFYEDFVTGATLAVDGGNRAAGGWRRIGPGGGAGPQPP